MELDTRKVLEHYVENDSIDELVEDVTREEMERIGQLAWSFADRVQFLEARIRYQYYNVMKSFERREFTDDAFAGMVKGQANEEYLLRLSNDESITKMVERDVLRNYDRYGLEL